MTPRRVACVLLLLSFALPSLSQPSFRDTKLRLGPTNYFGGIPTSLAFVPTDPSLLVVGTLGGAIRLIRVNRSGLLYDVVEELGEVSVGDRRSVLGISADPFRPNTFYASSSILFWRDKGLGEDGWQNGRVERVFFDPDTITIQLDENPAVKGLPVGPSVSGVFSAVVDPLTARLLISIPAFNNGGAPSEPDGNISDTILNAAVLEADIRRGGTLRLDWSSSDPKTAVLLKTAEESGIAIYAEGIRSAHQLAVSRYNRVFLVDGGANIGGGERSLSCFRSRPFAKSIPDKIIRLRQGRFYGHPNRQRGQCEFISPLLKAEVAQEQFPGYTPPLFTNADAIRAGDVGSGTVGVAFYESNLFPGFRGTLLGADAPTVKSTDFEERKVPGLVGYRVQKRVGQRLGDTPGISLAVNVFGDVFAAQAPNRTIGVAVPQVGPARRALAGIRGVFPARGVPGSTIFVAGNGMGLENGSIAIAVGGTGCADVEVVGGIDDSEVVLVKCTVPQVETFVRGPADVTMGGLKLTAAFTILDPRLAGEDEDGGGPFESPEESPADMMGMEGSPEVMASPFGMRYADGDGEELDMWM